MAGNAPHREVPRLKAFLSRQELCHLQIQFINKP